MSQTPPAFALLSYERRVACESNRFQRHGAEIGNAMYTLAARALPIVDAHDGVIAQGESIAASN
jgi:hypothetical protein